MNLPTDTLEPVGGLHLEDLIRFGTFNVDTVDEYGMFLIDDNVDEEDVGGIINVGDIDDGDIDDVGVGIDDSVDVDDDDGINDIGCIDGLWPSNSGFIFGGAGTITGNMDVA